jgi:hypothetical protein
MLHVVTIVTSAALASTDSPSSFAGRSDVAAIRAAESALAAAFEDADPTAWVGSYAASPTDDGASPASC